MKTMNLFSGYDTDNMLYRKYDNREFNQLNKKKYFSSILFPIYLRDNNKFEISAKMSCSLAQISSPGIFSLFSKYVMIKWFFLDWALHVWSGAAEWHEHHRLHTVVLLLSQQQKEPQHHGQIQCHQLGTSPSYLSLV